MKDFLKEIIRKKKKTYDLDYIYNKYNMDETFIHFNIPINKTIDHIEKKQGKVVITHEN